MKFHTKKSRFSVKSQFKELKGADGGHSLNRDFTVFLKKACLPSFLGVVLFYCQLREAKRGFGLESDANLFSAVSCNIITQSKSVQLFEPSVTTRLNVVSKKCRFFFGKQAADWERSAPGFSLPLTGDSRGETPMTQTCERGATRMLLLLLLLLLFHPGWVS